MYFNFQAEMIQWIDEERHHVETLQAEFLDDSRAFRDELIAHRISWFSELPIPIPPAAPLTFAVNAMAPLLDNYFAGGGSFDLFSTRLVSLLREVGVRFETFPATLVDRDTGLILTAEYELFHLLEEYAVVDELVEEWNAKHRSDLVTSTISGSTAAGNPSAKVDAVQVAHRPMFRLEDQALVVIHQNLKTILEEAGITGCSIKHYGRLRIRS